MSTAIHGNKINRCTFKGDNGECVAPAEYRAELIHPKGVTIYRCKAHYGHCQPNARWINGRWKKWEHPCDKIDRQGIERAKRRMNRIPF